jgi:hypothetical protein
MDESEAGVMLGYPANQQALCSCRLITVSGSSDPTSRGCPPDAKEGMSHPKYRNPNHEHDLFLPQHPDNKDFGLI